MVKKAKNKSITISSVLFILFFINVILAKIALVWSIEGLSNLVLGDVAEFLLLLITIIFFTLGILYEEKIK